MTTPITLPPSFFNSFWSPDYRTGLDVLFRQLEAVSVLHRDIGGEDEADSRERLRTMRSPTLSR